MMKFATCRGLGISLAFAILSGAASAQTLTTLYSFSGGNDGAAPDSGLIADALGNLYGTTPFGGTSNGGTVFKLTPPTTRGGPWTETVLWSFTGNDGLQPHAGLIADPGNLYGTTEFGGTSGLGTVFKLTPPTTSGGPWTQTVLWSFTGGSDGDTPKAGLIADASGNLYGTTQKGGLGVGSGTEGGGTVFKLTPPTTSGGPWTHTVLWAPVFSLGDLVNPVAGLIADASGALYGTATTDLGGTGGVFNLTPPTTSGGPWTVTAIWRFNGSDGATPIAALIADASGNLYGTTVFGGTSNGGTVFKLTPPTTSGGPWTQTVLWSFTGGSDGAQPSAGLIADASGNLYGTTFGTGTIPSFGTVFKLTLPATFVGKPGQANCNGQSITYFANTYGGMAGAAAALGYASVRDFQNAVASFCRS